MQDPCGGICCDDGPNGATTIVTYADPSNGPMDGYTLCCYGDVYVNAEGKEDCCATGYTVGSSDCPQYANYRRSGRPDIPLREGGTHIPLGPDQLVQYLTEGGMFSHNGESFVDKRYRDSSDNALRRLAKRGLGAAVRRVAPSFDFAPHLARNPEWALSHDYKFAWADAPEVYARLTANPAFERIFWRGVEFDRQTLYRLVSGLPNYNQTLVDEHATAFRTQMLRVP